MGSLPPGLYCEDRATFDLLVADPSVETATVPAGLPSPLLHSMRVCIATPAQAAILRAMPARTGATQPGPDWKAIRGQAERFLLDFCQPPAWDPPPLRGRRIGMPEPARRPMTSTLSAGALAALLANPGVPVTSGLARGRRRRDAARSRRGA
ncbi:hypothetical protein MKK58_06350 [Methylobacterium sp. J-078]|uniref:hypothetical protein n=1 Tax=Methylobacterium sp. J-078 TaxID=2836657 RepID=UPI001FBB3EC1|nr:hypothetical protein [Methylobacterium sp. J-078]MCJ2044152.1 hypothetical protein [Methylobacterium sp. J-078]